MRVRPARPVAPIVISVAVAATWWLVAHNSGDGWVQALGDLVFGALLIGVIGPAVVVRRARLVVLRSPGDASAGQPAALDVRASTRVRVRPVRPAGPEQMIGPARGRRGGDDQLTIVPARRGLHQLVTLDVASAAPFGLQWWYRRVELPLPEALHVAPRRGEADIPDWLDHQREGPDGRRRADQTGDLRAARPYRSGDHLRLVHWPATAHTGELMVRELESPAGRPVTVSVTLPGDAEAAERVAERALGTLLRLLDRDTPAVLETDEPGGPVTGPITDRRQAGRRLARAVARSGATQDRRPGAADGRGWLTVTR